MLTQLYIQNVAVIQKASIALGSGLNVFTGETGAGKTILISAIDAVLGERTSRDIIRTGEDRAVVSALFEDISAAAKEKLEELGYEDDEGSLLITREITAAGKNNCKIGGMPATVSILREISPLLIQIHGQRDSQQLLLPERHIELVDSFGDLAEDLAVYRAAYHEMRSIRAELDGLFMDDAQKAQRMDMLRFQINEIEAASLDDPEEEEALLARRCIIRNSEKILQGLSAGYAALSGGEETGGINDLFVQLTEGVADAAEHIAELEPMAARLTEIGYELADFALDIRSQLDSFEFDPRELDEMEYRLDTIHKLKRKYGDSVAEILAFCDGAREELDAIDSSEERTKQLEQRLAEAAAKAEKLAKSLTKKRAAAARQFMAQVEGELRFLDMPDVKLSARQGEKALSTDGADEVEFYITANVGEEPKPLSKIASGGEVARIMLAIKNVLANRDKIATLIFDEVDTGVSGRAAGKIGRKLQQVSTARQVICVTHLAQVAAFADTHLLIRKEVEKGRTYTRVFLLEEDQRVEELARITSGDMVTELALQNAAELLHNSRELAEKKRAPLP